MLYRQVLGSVIFYGLIFGDNYDDEIGLWCLMWSRSIIHESTCSEGQVRWWVKMIS